MPIGGPPSFASLREGNQSDAEITYAESRGKYIGSLCVATTIALVFGTSLRQLIPLVRVDSPAGLAIVAVLFAGASIFGFLIWRTFGLHLRHELRIHPSRDFVLVTHRLLGADKSVQVQAKGMREVLLVQRAWNGNAKRSVWELQIALQDGNGFFLDQCATLKELLPLAKTLSSRFALPLTEKPLT